MQTLMPSQTSFMVWYSRFSIIVGWNMMVQRRFSWLLELFNLYVSYSRFPCIFTGRGFACGLSGKILWRSSRIGSAFLGTWYIAMTHEPVFMAWNGVWRF